MNHWMNLLLVGTIVISAAVTLAAAADQPAKEPQLPPMPKGYEAKRDNISRGNVDTVEYDSTTAGAKRKFVVYTPPGYAKDKKYPVLYLLHGAKYNETSWTSADAGAANTILDNLFADKKLVPMVVVMPNGNVQAKAGKAKGGDATAAFESELLNDVMPLAEARYSIHKDAANRALAGQSMGGGQTHAVAFKHLDKFAWIGLFSPAIQGKGGTIPSAADAKKIKLLYLACGDADSFFTTVKNYHTSLEKGNMPHVWNVVPGGQHDFVVWKNDLYLLAPMLFK